MKFTTNGRRPAFSLMEVMISTGLFTGLASMILSLVVSMNWSLFDSQNKGTIDRNFRTTTSTLSQLVSCSDFVYIFTAKTDDAVALAATQVGPGLAGDYLVAVYYKNPGKVDSKTGLMDTTVSRITGVYRSPNDGKTGEGPVYTFDSAKDDWGVTFPAASDASVASVTALLPTAAKSKAFTKLADSVFATDDTGRIFTNTNGTGALMLARIRTGMSGKYVSSGYAFSVSSRNL